MPIGAYRYAPEQSCVPAASYTVAAVPFILRPRFPAAAVTVWQTDPPTAMVPFTAPLPGSPNGETGRAVQSCPAVGASGATDSLGSDVALAPGAGLG